MGSRDYPLQPVQQIRESDVEKAADALRERIDQVDKMAQGLARAKQKLAELLQQTTAIEEQEHLRRSHGVRTEELLQLERFRTRASAQARLLTTRLEAEEDAFTLATDEVERARTALGQAHAALSVVDRHKGKWQAAERALQEGREQSELDDLAARPK